MGWVDADGYLYVTGRSKEVINRGGEIISPAEVEEALISHPGLSDCVAGKP
jgi:acyl-coenzyme A synthetase/AMP-(fatty) acid ligase